MRVSDPCATLITRTKKGKQVLFTTANKAPIGSFIPEFNGFVEEVMIDPTGCVDCGEFGFAVFVTDKDSAKLTEWNVPNDHVMQVIEMKGN